MFWEQGSEESSGMVAEGCREIVNAPRLCIELTDQFSVVFRMLHSSESVPESVLESSAYAGH